MFTVLHHLDIAILKQTGSIAMPGQSIQMAITPSLTETKASTRARFTPVERQCYFDDEINLSHLPYFGYRSRLIGQEFSLKDQQICHLFRYEMSNCLYEASLQKIGKECNCTPSFFATYLPSPLPPCEGHMKFCKAGIMEDIGAERFISDNGVQKECLAPCHDQTHQFLVTSSAYPNRQSYHLGEDFCLVLAKLQKSCSNKKRRTLDLEYPELCDQVGRATEHTCDDIRGLTEPPDLEQRFAKLRKQVLLHT